MGMNFQLSFFETPENFFIVIAVMIVLAVSLVAIAVKRGWV
jgi:Mg2+ and Co2+ transporter CorA